MMDVEGKETGRRDFLNSWPERAWCRRARGNFEGAFIGNAFSFIHDHAQSTSTTLFTMPEIYNANPTIFATSKTSKLALAASKSLWPDDSNDTLDNENEEEEPIDADEIFGTYYGVKSVLNADAN